jgi:homoserine kinase
MQQQQEVLVQVPATSANLGPGYDCLGVALQIYNRVRVRKTGESAENWSSAMVEQAASAFFGAAQLPKFGFEWSIEGEVPQSRGMGSSVTVRLGLLHGLNQLCGHPLDATKLYQICAELEGHPDNAAPAAFGGFTVANPDGSYFRFEVEDRLQFVLLIPNFEVATPDARKLMPQTLPHSQAVASAANACRITAAFASKDYPMLRGAFVDYLHQPHRLPLIPFLNQTIEAAIEAGAIGGFLSGSGSTIACLTLGNAEAVGQAMLKAAHTPNARLLLTRADNTGVRLLS